MNTKDNTKEFRVELEALLKKYNASISWTCHWCSDLHGVHDSRLVLDVGEDTFEFASDSVTANNVHSEFKEE